MIDLRLGDCLEILPTLADNSVDAVITDPPYGTGETARKNGKITRTRQEWDNWNFDWFDYVKHLRGCFFVPSKLILTKIWEHFRLLSWNSKNPGKWHNVSPRYGIQTLLAYGKLPDKPSLDWCFHRSNIHTPDHPHQKPLEVINWLIDIVSNPGDTILDPFMGSGTTGVACVQTGRNFIGIEIDPKYYEIAEKRIKEAQLQIRMEI